MFSKPFHKAKQFFTRFGNSTQKRLNSTDHPRFDRFRKSIFDNPFNEYIKRYGDRPRILQKKYFDSQASKLILLTSLSLPLVYVFLLYDSRIANSKETTPGPLKEFEEYRKMRNAKKKQAKREKEELIALENEILKTKTDSGEGSSETKQQTASTSVATIVDKTAVPGITSRVVVIQDGESQVLAASAENNSEQEDAEEVVIGSANNGKYYKYVLVGGGTAAYSALLAIKKNDPSAEVLVLSEEDHLPYSRPPLSKDLWKSKDPNVSQNLTYTDFANSERNVEYKPQSYYDNNKVQFKSNSVVKKLDVADKTVTTEDGSVYKYDKCLLATGGSPLIIPGMEGVKDRAMTFRTVEDFRKLDNITKEKEKNIVIVGGSFLGTELAYSLAANRNVNVTQVYLEPEVLARNLPRYLSQEIRELLQSSGVRLRPNRNVLSVYQKKDGKVAIKMDGGEELVADYVLSATGIYPNTELAEDAGLEIDPTHGGIMTNAELEARNGVFVAGDVLSYYDNILGRRRSEHYEHATSTGRLAGTNMSSDKRKPYEHISMFWSGIGPVSFEAVGEISSQLNTYAVWDGISVYQNGSAWNNAPAPMKTKGFSRGVVYYLRDKRVVGVLFWNVRGKIREARNLISSKTEVDDYSQLKNLISIPPEKH